MELILKSRMTLSSARNNTYLCLKGGFSNLILSPSFGTGTYRGGDEVSNARLNSLDLFLLPDSLY